MSTKRATEPIKPHKKVILSWKRSKNPKSEGVDTNKGSRGRRNVEIDKDVSVCYGDNKLYLKEKGGRGKFKSNASDRESKEMGNDYKRKRVYADRDNSRDENDERPKGRVLRERNELRDDVGRERRFTRGEDNVGKERRPMRGEDDVGKERQPRRGKSYDSERYEQNREFKRERRFQEDDSLGGNDGRKLRIKVKGGSAFDSKRQLGQSRDQRTPDSLGGKYAKKKMQDKRNSGTSLAENDERPKRGKRVIRIDPRDITNKRLDDSISTAGHSKEKKEEDDAEESGSDELSKNAQFRAIQPSPSILSFVEDNLLGRRRMIELRRAGYNIELSAPLDNIPMSTSLERERIEEPIFRNKLTFFAAAKVSSSFPPPELPEIAFAGRSNVGKSSLLNALTRQWGTVRTSDKPGLTQTINFFKLEPKLSLVDLPGYGFAYAKDEVKEAWEELVKEYVSTRVGLKRVCLLVDTKWGMKPRDHELIDLMERSETKYQVVLTKTDLVFPIDVARRAMQIEESFKGMKSAVQPVMMISSKSGAGIRTLRTVLAKIGRYAKI